MTSHYFTLSMLRNRMNTMFIQHTILAVSHIVLLGLSFSACDALIQYS